MFGFGVGIQRLGSFGVDTLAALNALAAPASGLRPTGFVYADPDPAKNGVYTWTGSAWVRDRGLPEQVATLTVTGGAPNAIVATAQAGVDLAQIVLCLLTPTAANTGAVTLNGKAIKDADGAALVAGALVAGKTYLLTDRGTEFRVLLNEFAHISDIANLQATLDTLQGDVNARVVGFPTKSSAESFVFPSVPQAVHLLGYNAVGDLGGATYAGPVSTDPGKSDALAITVAPGVLRWLRRAHENGEVDLIKHGLYGDAATNNLRNETTAFLDAIALAADLGLKRVVAPRGKAFKLIQGRILSSVEIALRGSGIYGEFANHDSTGYYTLNCLYSEEADNLDIVVDGAFINGQNNPAQLMQGGVPMLDFKGGTVRIKNSVITRGANRRYTGGVNTVPTTKNAMLNAEILIRNAREVYFEDNVVRSSPGEMFQAAFDTGKEGIVVVRRNSFTKKRDFNSGLWSSSAINVFNALKFYLGFNVFNDFIKGPVNGECDDILAEFNTIRRVSDSNGLDFCEARTQRQSQIITRGNYLEDIANVGIRASPSNFLSENDTINRVDIGISLEGGVVGSPSADDWLKKDAAPLYNCEVKNLRIKDFDSTNHANLICVRAIGASSSMPVHLTVDGSSGYDRANTAAKKPLYGVWAENAELVLRGYHGAGRNALFRGAGHFKAHLIGAQCDPEDIAGDSAHIFELNTAVLPARAIVVEKSKGPAALASGWYGFRNTSSTIDIDAIHVNNSPDFPATSNNAVIWKNGFLVETTAVNPPPMNVGQFFKMTLTVIGARVGDAVVDIIANAAIPGFAIDNGRVTANNTVEAYIRNVDAGAAADPGSPISMTTIVKKRT